MPPQKNLPPKSQPKKQLLGRRAEDFAAGLLRLRGYKIIDRNFRSRFGEIDIIALKGDTLVFAEVKARSSSKFGLPEEAVTPAKIYKIKRTAEYYSLTHPSLPKNLRIIVVALDIRGDLVSSSRILKVEP